MNQGLQGNLRGKMNPETLDIIFRDALRVAGDHGGDAADWVKKSSSSYAARDGVRFETHWVENVKSGQRVEFKTKFPGGP